MTVFDRATALALALAALAAPPIQAQATPSASMRAGPAPVAGDGVRDMNGAEVGTIVGIDGDAAHVRTDRLDVLIPLDQIARGRSSYVIAMSREQVNRAADEAMAVASLRAADAAAQSLAAASGPR